MWGFEFTATTTTSKKEETVIRSLLSGERNGKNANLLLLFLSLSLSLLLHHPKGMNNQVVA